jgi:membrane-associated phospholipid phosphatase
MSAANGSRRRVAALVLAAAASIALAQLLDPWAHRVLHVADVYEKDWGRLLRIMGFAPTWLAIAVAVWLEERSRRRTDGPPAAATLQAVVLAVIVGGLGSELLKLLIRRERPAGDGMAYSFRAFADDPFSTSRLGMPSGHTMVAFAGAAALGRRFPRAAPILYGLAAGCGLTRVFAQAHFLSDVVAAGLGGTVTGRWVAGRVFRRAARG